jgi:hypothetical protein
MAKCPACTEPRDPRKYLCGSCWQQLPEATQRALYRRDGQALMRYRRLLDAITNGTPLGEISVDA